MLKILGIPTILGCNVSGCDKAPDYIRKGGLYNALKSSNLSFEDLGDLIIDNSFTDSTNSKAKNLEKIQRVVDDTYLKIISNVSSKDKVFCLGGDHSMAIGSIFASRQRFENLGIVWIDAPADSNSPETSLTGNIHGMPLSTVMGDSLFNEFKYSPVKKQNVVLLGIKDVDPAEWDYIHKNNITAYTMDDIVEKGIGRIWLEIEQKLKSLPIHVSMDIDGLDYEIAPGTGIVNNGGINYREIKYLSHKLSLQNLVALDITEINPLRDIDNKTQSLAIELAMDYLGGRWTEYERYLYQSSKKESLGI